MKCPRPSLLIVSHEPASPWAECLHDEWSTHCASDIQAAVHSSADLILIDSNVMGAEMLWKRPSDTPVIVLCPHADPAFEARALDAGAADVLIGPIILPTLRARIRKCLATQRALRSLEQLATHDALTGLYNRRKLDEELEREIARATRHSRPFSIILLDLDHFKRVNDTHGHPAGDRVLRETADRLSNALRLSDCIGRWGGDEFLILCPETPPANAIQLAQRLERVLEPTAQTASWGVATHSVNSRAREMIEQADRALYTAKQAGLNQENAALSK